MERAAFRFLGRSIRGAWMTRWTAPSTSSWWAGTIRCSSRTGGRSRAGSAFRMCTGESRRPCGSAPYRHRHGGGRDDSCPQAGPGRIRRLIPVAPPDRGDVFATKKKPSSVGDREGFSVSPGVRFTAFISLRSRRLRRPASHPLPPGRLAWPGCRLPSWPRPPLWLPRPARHPRS